MAEENNAQALEEVAQEGNTEEQPTAETGEKSDEPVEGTKAEISAEDNKDEDGFAAEVLAVVNRQSTSDEIETPEEKPIETPEEKIIETPEEKPTDTEEEKPTDTEEEKPTDTEEEKPTEEKEEVSPAPEQPQSDIEPKDEKEVTPPPQPKATGIEEMVVPNLLTEEEITAKGIPVPDVDDYRRFYLKQSYSPNKWYEAIKDHTFETDFIILSKEEIDVILAAYHPVSEEAPSLTERQTQTLQQLSDKITAAIEKFEDSGAFIKLNKHSPKDSVLDKCDPEYKQTIQDAIVTDMEVENQFANAYLTWRSWRSSSFRESNTSSRRDNVIRRSFRRIQKNFRPRSQSVVVRTEQEKKDEPLEEVSKDEVEKKEEAPLKEGEEAKPEGDQPNEEKEEEKKEEEGEVKEDEEKKEESDKPAEEEAKPQEEPTEDTTAPITVEATVEGGASEEGGATAEGGASEEGKADDDKVEAVDDKPAAELEEVKEEKEESEITVEPVKNKPRSALSKKEHSQEHVTIKVKSETLQNKVLRAFTRTINQQNRVTNGQEAIALITTSIRVNQDLRQVKAFEDVDGTEAVLSIRRWNEDFAKYPGMLFRGFVYKNQLNGLSQFYDVAYIPNIARYRSTIENKIELFFNEQLKQALEERESYIADLFVAPNKIFVVDLSPFHTSTGACLFTWQQNKRHLMSGPMEMKFIATPFKQCFTGLAPHWQQICETVAQQKSEEDRHSGRSCTIL